VVRVESIQEQKLWIGDALIVRRYLIFLFLTNSILRLDRNMQIEELNLKKEEFDMIRDDWEEDYKEAEGLRKKFVSDFTIERIKRMTIDEYIVGKGNHFSFCYWLETGLKKLGNMKGGATAPQKFGVYYGITKSDLTVKYRTTGYKWGVTPEEAFENIRNELILLIEDGKDKNISKLIDNKISPMFKGKILATYYPDRYINVFSPDHLDYFLETFNIPIPEHNIEKREKLLEFKNNDPIMKKWSIYEFGVFLYNYIKPNQKSPLYKDKNELIKRQKSISKDEDGFLKLSIVDKKEEKKEEKIKINFRDIEIDFQEQYEKNKEKGDKGEKLVFDKEKEYLKSKGKSELANKVKDVSKEFRGYDILSYDLEGKEKYIEVKSTSSKPSNVTIYVSSNEYEKAKGLDNYYLYIVFNVLTNPDIVKLENPFKNPEKINIIPINYKVELNLK
jgi:hypothetical protein